MKLHAAKILLATLLAVPALYVEADQVGIASWYGPRFHGRRAANGEIYNQYRLTAAHRHLPFGTRVKVTNLENGKRVLVRITDRGPYVRGRIIDLSRAAARKLHMTQDGIARISLEVVSTP